MDFSPENIVETTLSPNGFHKTIHLLYVPTLFCNLGCSYCYLGSQTDTGHLSTENDRALHTLQFAVEKFMQEGALPFNVSLHGGEVTVLKENTLDQLFGFIKDYYGENRTDLEFFGFKKDKPHIKTNLYNFDRYEELFIKNEVSISASIDLPLSMHEKYRTTKAGKSTLEKTLDNLRRLAKYPHRAKFSSVICHEHLLRKEEIVKDIWFIHNELGFDMNNYNFMFGFESELNQDKFGDEHTETLKTLSGPQQVEFYEFMKENFKGTELEKGLNTLWFEEFTPAFCTNAVNCGEKFFLLQGDGEIYSCVRGQGVEAFHYGNIFKDSVEDIFNTAVNKIQTVHNQLGVDESCRSCSHLNTCNTGCAFVKYEQQNPKSYSCDVQRELYKDFPELSTPNETPDEQEEGLREFLSVNHPQEIFYDRENPPAIILPNDLEDDKNALVKLIEADDTLRELYNPMAISLLLDGEEHPLESQILKKSRSILFLDNESDIKLRIRKSWLKANCKEAIRNTLYLMMLRDTPVVYGDEQRTKQEHTFTHQVFHNILEASSTDLGTHLEYDLGPLLKLYAPTYQDGVLNNLFVTTNALRDYHYAKQKENAFYHIQAINLPFQNVEFYWTDM